MPEKQDDRVPVISLQQAERALCEAYQAELDAEDERVFDQLQVKQPPEFPRLAQ